VSSSASQSGQETASPAGKHGKQAITIF